VRRSRFQHQGRRGSPWRKVKVARDSLDRRTWNIRA
jgi:hypothetical protein